MRERLLDTKTLGEMLQETGYSHGLKVCATITNYKEKSISARNNPAYTTVTKWFHLASAIIRETNIILVLPDMM